MDYFFIILIVVAILLLFFTKSGKDFQIKIKERAKIMMGEKKKHIRNSLIIVVVITIFMVIAIGVENIGTAILIGLGIGFTYIGFYFSGVLGFNPIVNAVKDIGSDNDYGIKSVKDNSIKNK